MSRGVHVAPLALTSDGDVLLIVAMFDAPKDLASLVRFAKTQSEKLFIGVAL